VKQPWILPLNEMATRYLGGKSLLINDEDPEAFSGLEAALLRLRLPRADKFYKRRSQEKYLSRGRMFS